MFNDGEEIVLTDEDVNDFRKNTFNNWNKISSKEYLSISGI